MTKLSVGNDVEGLECSVAGALADFARLTEDFRSRDLDERFWVDDEAARVFDDRMYFKGS